MENNVVNDNSNTNNIQIFFDDDTVNNKFENLYPLSIEINEGISFINNAKLIVLTTKTYTNKDLLEILGKKIYISLSQTINKIKYTRYFTGIVTQFKNSGVIYSNSQSRNTCVKYELIIEDELINLSYDKKTKTYFDKTPIEVLTTILNGYNVVDNTQSDTKSDTQSNVLKNKYIIFHQTKESDLDFMKRILFSFGLNFYIQYKKEDENKNIIQSYVYITDRYKFSPISYILDDSQDKATTYASLNVALNKSSDNGIIPVSTFEIEASYNKNNEHPSNYKMRGIDYNENLSNGTEKVVTEYINKNISDYNNKLQPSFNSVGSDIRLLCGALLKIDELSVPSDGNESQLNCLIVKSTLTYSSRWPNGYAIPLDNENSNEIPVNQKLFGFIGDDSGTFYSLDFGLNTILSNNYQESSGAKYFKGIVCDKNGSTSPRSIIFADEANTLNPTKFYVLDESGNVKVLNYVSIYGGNISNQIYFPHVGDEVFVYEHDEKYFLQGYSLQGYSLQGVSDDLLNPAKDRLSNKLNNMFSLGSSKSNISINETSLIDVVSKHIIDGTIDAFATKINMQNFSGQRERIKKYKDIIKNTNYPKVIKDKYDDIQKNYNTLNSMSNTDEKYNKAEEDYKQVYASYVEVLGEVSNKADEIIKLFELGENNNVQIPTISSTNSGGQIKQEADDIEIDASKKLSLHSGGDIKCSSPEKVEIVADKEISLSVGGSNITITPDNISILSRKWAHGQGPLDAAISLDSLRGTVITGGSVDISSFYNTTLSDSFGGYFGISTGLVSAKGNSISLETNTGFELATPIAEILKFIFQFISIFEDDESTWHDHVNDVFDGLAIAVDTVKNFVNTPKWKDWKFWLPTIVRMIAEICDRVYDMIEREKSEWCKEPTFNIEDSCVTNGDAIKLTISIVKLTTSLFGYIPTLEGVGVKTQSSLKMTKDIELEAVEIHNVSTTFTTSNTTLAGTNPSAQQTSQQPPAGGNPAPQPQQPSSGGNTPAPQTQQSSSGVNP